MIIQKNIIWCFLLFFSLIRSEEEIGHECGLALVWLRKPLVYYQETYDDLAWGVRKVCALIEEQRNRGQDGAGVAVMKFNMEPGDLYLRRLRYAGQNAIDLLLKNLLEHLSSVNTNKMTEHDAKITYDFLGEIYLGHVRYGTHADDSLRCCQPYLCKNSVASKNFALAGNFNMTNPNTLCQLLTNLGLTPTSKADTHIILELISYYLEQEYNRLLTRCDAQQNRNKADTIAQKLDIVQILRDASKYWDGGYVFAGIIGNGDAFICRDPAGIRPGFFYVDDEVIAAASERSALMNAFGAPLQQIQELKPGHVLIIKKNGDYNQYQFIDLLPIRQCSFERIYFSKPCDPAIYQERKLLGKYLAERVLRELGDDLEQAIFTYVPNSSESAFIGLMEELHHLRPEKMLRVEKLIYKNQRLRTFIANDHERNNLVARLYTMTSGIVTCQNILVVIDDSIVRGTTLRQSIVKELFRLNPKRVIFVSSAPPVLYPDCYGIDMSQIGLFIAFQAVIELLKESEKTALIEEIKNKCEAQKDLPSDQMVNYVHELYDQFSGEQLSEKIAELATQTHPLWEGRMQIVYQTIEGLHKALPDYMGDWCFTGNYPTPGGYKVLNTSYLNWYKGSTQRAY